MENIMICPNCGINLVLPPSMHLDFRISLTHIREIPGISIYKTITNTMNNQGVIHDFCLNSWKHKPFIAKIEQTTSYHNVITELIRHGVLKPEELY